MFCFCRFNNWLLSSIFLVLNTSCKYFIFGTWTTHLMLLIRGYSTAHRTSQYQYDWYFCIWYELCFMVYFFSNYFFISVWIPLYHSYDTNSREPTAMIVEMQIRRILRWLQGWIHGWCFCSWIIKCMISWKKAALTPLNESTSLKEIYN